MSVHRGERLEDKGVGMLFLLLKVDSYKITPNFWYVDLYIVVVLRTSLENFNKYTTVVERMKHYS